MKNIFKISILGIAVFFASCADLEETNVGALTPSGYFQVVNDVVPMIMGTYATMASSNYYGGRLTSALQLMSDMIDTGFEFSDYIELSPFTYTPTNSYVRDLWRVSYQTILTANTAIEGLAIVEEPEEARRNRFIGEARFVRAFVYYHLVRLYGNIPYIDNTDQDPSTLEQSSSAEVYAKIIEDLTFAFDHLSTNPQGGVRSRPSKGTAASYLASVHMTLGNWQESYNNAKWVIDNAGTLDYELAGDFQDLYRDTEQWGSKEYIFIMDFTGNQRGNGSGTTLENDQTHGPFNGVSGGDKPIRGWSMLIPPMTVYNDWDAVDYRKKVSFTDSLILRDGTGIVRPYTDFAIPLPHASKWNRFYGEAKTTAGWRSDLDYPAFRYAEVLLIAAEAANELSQTGEAVGYVNEIRSRARRGGTIDFFGNGYGTYEPSAVPADVVGTPSQEDFRTLVLEERRIEFAFEWKRWYDIVRRDLGGEVFGPSGREPQSNFATFRYLLPIPQDEVDLVGYTQNPGY